MRWIKALALLALVLLVVAGHVGLWSSDSYSLTQKWRLTILNAVAWAVIVLPAIGVGLWARAHRDDRGG